MQILTSPTPLPRYLRIPLIYGVLSSSYIVLSGFGFGNMLDYTPQILRVEVTKGLLFVAATTAILWYALYREHRAGHVGATTFRVLVEHLPDAVFLVRIPERRILYANPAAASMFGRAVDQLVGAGTDTLHVSREHYEKFHALTNHITRDQPFVGEFEMRDASGRVFPTSHLVALFHDDSGHEYVLSVIRDESARHHYESELRESEARLRQIAENLREVLWITDPDKQHMLYASPAYERVWGRPVAELYQRPRSFLDAVHPEDRPTVEERAMRQAIEPYDMQYRITRPDGELRWIRDRAVPLQDSEGYVTRVVGIAEDITEIKRHEDELRLAQKMDALGQLTGGIAHDFNNLLTVILGSADSIDHALEDDAPLRPAVRDIVTAAQRAATLTQRLLAYSRRQSLRAEPLDLNAMVRESAQLLARTIGANIAIETELDESVWPVQLDREQLETSLLNLAINARDAMPDGGTLSLMTTNVQLTEQDAEPSSELSPGDYVRVTIADTGIGMPADVIARAFDPFFSTKEPGKGTGLGLSMVYGFVKQSGGDVTIHSEPGAGTQIVMYLPRAPAAVPVAA